MRVYVLDENKNVVETRDRRAWFEFMESPAKRVALTETEKYVISTVFLGFPHIGGIFETMVFDDSDSGLDLYYERYNSWAAAQQGHDRIVKQIEKGELP